MSIHVSPLCLQKSLSVSVRFYQNVYNSSFLLSLCVSSIRVLFSLFSFVRKHSNPIPFHLTQYGVLSKQLLISKYLHLNFQVPTYHVSAYIAQWALPCLSTGRGNFHYEIMFFNTIVFFKNLVFHSCLSLWFQFNCNSRFGRYRGY